MCLEILRYRAGCNVKSFPVPKRIVGSTLLPEARSNIYAKADRLRRTAEIEISYVGVVTLVCSNRLDGGEKEAIHSQPRLGSCL